MDNVRPNTEGLMSSPHSAALTESLIHEMFSDGKISLIQARRRKLGIPIIS